MDEHVILPVGTILPYAGEVVGHLHGEGWLLCDGASVAVAQYTQLHEAIGTRFGKLSQDTFCLPRLNGVFLRGRQGTAAHRNPGGDPDAAGRPFLQPGGRTGNEVGSLQPYATARSHNPIAANVASGEIVSRDVIDSGETLVADYTDESNVVRVDSGGDLESRPRNKYVHFIIKYKHHTDAGRVVEAPIGALMAFAGVMDSQWHPSWKLCNGDVLSNRGVFKDLFDALKFGNGKLDDTQFYLPDYRGQFLRGVNGGNGFDPEAATRLPPMPQNPPGHQGNSGDAVGSAQGDATGLPVSEPFTTSYPHLPQSSVDSCKGTGADVCLWNGDGLRIGLSGAGGDAETRPVNVAVGWYVRFC
jgi:microcystin-dependent protein